jgi:glycine/D-amino acid oxidase-like deaminating enzyme
MDSPKIGIVGAGPGGLTLARILSLHGVRAAVFEREPSPSARKQGGSLDMHAETGQFAIECCGLTDAFNRLARHEDQETRVYDKRGQLLFVDDDAAAGDRPEIDRGQLRQLLIDSLPAGLCVGTLALVGQGDWGAAIKGYEDVMGTRAEEAAIGAKEGIEETFFTDGLSYMLRQMRGHRTT